MVPVDGGGEGRNKGPMPRRFFELYDDLYVRGRWHLKNPTDSNGGRLDDWAFRHGRPVSFEERLKILIEQNGKPLDFSETNSRIPIVHVKLATVFSELARDDVQLLPVDIEGQPDQYLVLVATRLIRCIDEKASKVQFWQPEDGLPDKVGQYYAVDHMRVDKATIGDARVFRPEGWPGDLIVSEEIKDALERMSATGAKFEEV
ncbi:MAG: imm11 family protein [Hyalangium sp.]|uniref:imm11 family protein n=1 Tax=Hyalangium sp. TaxID=2028555 RepID=UPI00389A08B9